MIPPGHDNPQTGPFFIEGAEPGDTVAIHINKLEPARDHGISSFVPGFGALNGTDRTAMLGADLPEKVWFYDVDRAKGVARTKSLDGKSSWEVPLAPFLGCLGVSPGQEVRSTIVPDFFGGNMDCPEVRAGNTVYLGVNVPGALLSFGDGHYAMGDGEIIGTAIEGAMNVDVTVDLIKGRVTRWPRIENSEWMMTVGAGRPLEDAARVAFKEMVHWVQRHDRPLGDGRLPVRLAEREGADHGDGRSRVHGAGEDREEAAAGEDAVAARFTVPSPSILLRNARGVCRSEPVPVAKEALMRLRAIAVLFTILIITPAFAATQHAAIPRLTVSEGDDGTLPLTLDSLQIHVLLRGHLARTTYDLTYRNGTNRELDGDFAFPLPPDAEISDLGLYFNGRLRHAVPVERVMARSIYETTVHRRVDPALAEWTASSRAFHFRIYPIPANGVKVVHIAYDQELTANPYELDLRYGATLPNVELTIESDSRIDAVGLPLARSGDRWSMRRTQYQLDGVIRAVADKRETAISARSADGNWYASAAVNLRSTARQVEPATHMTILYDASASAVQRDDAKVREYLRQLLARQKIASISVVPFHISVDAAVETDAGDLEQTLAAIPAAGATNLAELLDQLPAIAASQPAGSRIVLVSDGINSIGDASRLAHAVQQVAKMRRPLTIINASPSADDRFLGGLARATGGWYLDLTHVDPATAAEASMRRPELLMISVMQPPIRDVLPSSVLTTSDASITVSGRSRDPIVAFPVITGNVRHEIPVEVLETEEGIDLVRRAWARARLRELLESGATPEEVLEHGRKFSQLTPRTSLLVLERWQDYESNGLPLPPDLREEKEAEQQRARDAQAAWERNQREAMQARAQLAADRSAADARSDWFITGQVVERDTPLPGVTVTLIPSGRQALVQVTDTEGRFHFGKIVAPVSAQLMAQLSGFNPTVQRLDHPAKGKHVVLSLTAGVRNQSPSPPRLLK